MLAVRDRSVQCAASAAANQLVAVLVLGVVLRRCLQQTPRREASWPESVELRTSPASTREVTSVPMRRTSIVHGVRPSTRGTSQPAASPGPACRRARAGQETGRDVVRQHHLCPGSLPTDPARTAGASTAPRPASDHAVRVPPERNSPAGSATDQARAGVGELRGGERVTAAAQGQPRRALPPATAAHGRLDGCRLLGRGRVEREGRESATGPPPAVRNRVLLLRHRPSRSTTLGAC